MAAGDLLTADSLQIWAYRGDGREEHLVKSVEAKEFQSTLAAQLPRDYKLTVGKFCSVLGTRGDYLLLKINLTNTALASVTAETEVDKMFIEVSDIQNVDSTVQLSKTHGYGKFSPFESPALRVTKEMLRGITSESVGMSNTVSTSAGTTYTSQKVNGATDSRVQCKFDVTVAADTNNIFYMRIKPTAANVILLRPDSAIWVLAPVKTTTNGFYEKSD